ncbi:hypothetical protein NLM33_39410 [Bradyrhizobium sp. CCGUVB1N3]|uniref:hypothetical protein n=1 Tax=Bradyrhizobium sp. CCGUVB1N3 TaxID=2949629 RepID=UPI0020B3F177|nr:hypothetical protein [Bradyrhizobium sp. CCGUVB1N3]MCP3476289.1 hypothetical protein [Bradyrhizobium sp. CCGUVB1N3]
MLEPTPFRTEQLRLETGERFVLTVDADGMPAWWPNLYCQIRIRERGISYSAMRAYMSAVCAFHNICAELIIDVDARIESLELFREEEIATLRDELREKRRNPTESVKNAHWKSRLIAVAEYIVWRCDPVIDRMVLDDKRLPEARRRLEALPKRLVGKIVVKKNTSKEGMDEKTEQAFLDAITPGHPTNPFNKRSQVRNQALWRLYHAGLRRSAPLILTGGHLHLNGDDPYVFVPRSPDDPNDPRADEPRNKTLAHSVSLRPDSAAILHDYMVKDRLTYPGAKKSKYIFLSQESSEKSPKPLSIGAVVGMYERLREKVPGIPADFAPHMVRRTNKDRMGDAAEEAGLSPSTEQSVINQQSGWTPTSETSLQYQRRRLRRKGNQLAIVMQDKATGGRANG